MGLQLVSCQRQRFYNDVFGGDLEVMRNVCSQERFTSDLQFSVQSLLFMETTDILASSFLES